MHRSALINLEEIVEVQPWFNQTVLLIMINHLKIPVGSSYQAKLNQRLVEIFLNFSFMLKAYSEKEEK